MEATELKSLHPLEVKVLNHYDRQDRITVSDMQQALDLKEGQCNQAISWLTARGALQEVSRTESTVYELTDFGREQASQGTPEQRLLAYVREHGPTPMNDLAEAIGLEKKDIGSAFGALSKAGAVRMGEGKRVELLDEDAAPWVAIQRAMIDRAARDGALDAADLTDEQQNAIASIAKKRGASGVAFKISERSIATLELTEYGERLKRDAAAAGLTGEEVGSLTPAMLKDGSWKQKTFREYSINMAPARLVPGRRNPYAEYIETVKDKLVGLGFEEFDGPLVETEFWNSDALFMPQFHAARDIHDVYYVAEPKHAREIEQPWLDQIAAAHENGWKTASRGWGYDFDRDFTRRLILRSQGTVLSAKQLPKAKVPGRYFGIVRCFRYDQVDATHLSDFYQTEGIVLGEDVNLRTLLGMLQLFAEEVAGAEEVRYVPGYFPFTEPSVEVHIKHPELGWFELGGSGIFRPEVTEPLGIDVPVLAWGLGIDRMALMHLGLNDLRELFSTDLERVRLRRRK